MLTAQIVGESVPTFVIRLTRILIFFISHQSKTSSISTDWRNTFYYIRITNGYEFAPHKCGDGEASPKGGTKSCEDSQVSMRERADGSGEM